MAMRVSATMAAVLAVAGCAEAGGLAPPIIEPGVAATVTTVASEPRPHIFPESLGRWPNGDLHVPSDAAFVTESPALRVSGAADEGAARAAAEGFCGGPLAFPPEFGGVPARLDPPTGDFVLYATC